MEENISKRPLLGYAFAVLLFVIAMLYARVQTSTYTLDGHKFYIAGFMEQKIDGKSYFIPIYRESH